MSAPTEQRSPLLQFLDAFFQERNIKWMLGIGMLILLGSSLMLVTSHWDRYTPVWKYLILLGYTAGIHGLGQLCYHSLALRKTGTGLMVLTVLLIPLTFLGLHWVHPAPLTSWTALIGQTGLVTLLIVNTTFAILAARRIFNHCLRRSQPTFIASYTLLAMSGAIVPALADSLAPIVALCLWCVFAAGAMKVNRHVFWLTEEHRLPRVVGFFPILLLGGMFLTLLAVSLAPHIPINWFGFGLVMTAIPVLLTADALAQVFQQRNLTVPRPLPWSLVLPIFLGLCLTVSGLGLAAVGFPRSYVLTPAAALAAVVLGTTANRTRRSAFVWLMLGAVVTAYQASPAFFLDVARAAIRHGADAVHEPRLPYAFYGLTYLPLLAGLSAIAAYLRSHRNTLLLKPLRQASTGVGLILLAASLTEPKALVPVGLASAVLFGMQTVLFRDRRLLPAAIIAFVVTGIGTQTFVEQILLWPANVELPLLAWVVTAALLFWPGGVIDRRSQRLRETGDLWQTAPFCQAASLGILVVTSAMWLVAAIGFGKVAVIAGMACGVLLTAHAWRLANRVVARLAFAYLVSLVAVLAFHAGWTMPAVLSLASLLLAVLWMAGRNLRVRHNDGIATGDDPHAAPRSAIRVLRLAGADVAHAGLLGIALLFALPTTAHTVLTGAPFTDWIVGVVSLLWSIDAACRLRSGPLTALAWLLAQSLLGALVAAAFGWTAVFQWYPALATILPLFAIVALPRETRPDASILEPAGVLRICAVATLMLVAIGSLAVFTVPLRIAGLAAFAGLLHSAARWQNRTLNTAAFAVASWQGLVAVLQIAAPGLHSVRELSLPLRPSAALPLTLAATALAVVWNSPWMQRRTTQLWPVYHRVLFLLMAFNCLGCTLSARGGLSVQQAILAALAFLLLTGEQISTAWRCVVAEPDGTGDETLRRRVGERHVWLAEVIAGIGVSYLCFMGVLTFGGGKGLFAPLIVGWALYAIGRVTHSSNVWRVFSRPFMRTSYVLPIVTVAIGVVRHLSAVRPHWAGLYSLALLLAAAFYFWRGLERRTPALLLGSAAILNVAAIMLWRELHYTDPQFFMIPLGLSVLGLIELLKPQIPTASIDPLRYVGALTILVSPTFHIVAGSWLHLLTLLIASVLITLLAIGLRVRALMYAGTAFLTADLVAMVVRGSLDNTSLLWIVGILVGGAVIALAAYCERHRELMLQRVRMLASRLEAWE